MFLNVLAGVMGDYATTAAMDSFTASVTDKHPTDFAMLQGARMVSASETEEGRAWAIVGAIDGQKNGLLRPDVVVDATNEYFTEQDSVRQWVEECCETGGRNI